MGDEQVTKRLWQQSKLTDDEIAANMKSPGLAIPRSSGRLGAAACTMRSQHAHASFTRTCRITMKLSGMRSNISETSSPNLRTSPPQSGQDSCFGEWVRTSLGRCAGNGFRTDRTTDSMLVTGSGI